MKLLIHRLWNELRAARGRWAALLLALTLSVAAVVALAQAGERLSLAMRENYLATAPAHAQLLLSPGIDAASSRELVAELARQDGVAGARLGMSGSTRLRAQGSEAWHPALLFALPDPGSGAVAQGRATRGPWPRDGELWIERDAAKLLGGARTVTLADGTRLAITGSQHDPALAPASTEGVVYAYLPARTLLALPADATQTSVLLRFTGVEAERDQARADAAARRAAAWLTGRGMRVQALRVPPLAEHPHQRQADGAVRMLLACALLSAVLCAVTAAALLRGWLDGQRHALGVLKVLGASRTSLVASSLIVIAGLTSLAALAGLLLGLGAGEALARVSAGLLNLELLPWRASRQALAAGLSLGLLLPLAFSAVSIWRWAGQSPAVALAQRELQRPDAFSRLPLPGPLAARMALRNVLRRRQRFVLSSLLMATAGAVFMGGLNLRAAWGHLLDQSAAQRLYQIELHLPAPAAPAAPAAQATRSALAPLLQVAPEVQLAEAWNAQRATWVDGQGFAVSRTYPDGGHGQLLLRQVPPDAKLLRTTLLAGRWLEDRSELVINQAAAALLDRPVKLGDTLEVMVGDARLAGRLVGRIEEPMSPATVYRRAPPDQPGTHWRLQLTPGSDPQAVAARLLASAARMGLPGLRAVTERDVRHAAAGHLLLLQQALGWVALSTGMVGVVALASALGSGVAERRHELGLLHALGAPDRLLALTVMGEALLVVMVSLVLALALGWLLDPLLAERLGQISGQPLRPRAAGLALPLWSLLALVGGLLASAAASRAATPRCNRP